MASHLEGFGAGARRAEAKKPSKCGLGLYADSFSANISIGLLLIVAAIMALDRCIRHEGENAGSVYDDPDRGLIVF